MGKVSIINNGSPYVQQTTLEELKCSQCRRYLSVTPILKRPEGDAICGRCTVNDDARFYRDELYEAAIKFQKFPCSNRESGCFEYLFPVQVAEHEERCPYRKYECPTKVYNNCNWEGALSDLLEHFRRKHAIFVIKENKFEVDFINTHNENYLMTNGDDLFVVTREGNSSEKLFRLTVNYLGNKSEICKGTYELSLETGNRAFQYTLKQNIGEQLELQGDVVREKLNDPVTIIANISVKYNNQLDKNDMIMVDDEYDNSIDSKKLREMECPICLEYMLPPVYQCETGHSLCKTCKESLSECPTCKAPLRKTQNFALERIIMQMIYPCKHQGCKYKCQARTIRKHEASCLYGPFTCPLREYENCSQIFPVFELFNHIKSVHYEYLLELDTISIPFDNSITEDISDAFLQRRGELLFKICFLYKHDESKFCWTVQLVGPPEESAKYNYELEIIDNNARNQRMYLKTSSCSPLASKEESFQNLDNYVYFHADQILKFMKNQLTYRIIINRI